MKIRDLVLEAVIGGFLVAAAFLSGSGQVDELEARLKKDPDNRALLLDLGRACHNLAFQANDGRLIEKADKYLTRLLNLEPANAAAMVYLGSTKTQRAQASQDNPARAFEFLQEGFTLMDKAVLAAPDNAEIRFLRAVNSAQIPDMFGRLPVAIEDFQALEALIEKHPSCLPKDQLIVAYFFQGEALMKNGETAQAEKAYRRAIETDPSSPLAERARGKLSRRKGR